VDRLSFDRERLAIDKRQLQRHGARYPTTSSAEEMKAALKKLQSAKHYKEDYLKFLKHYTWDLGENDLIPLGAKQCVATDFINSADC
jgi:hypothetical protein